MTYLLNFATAIGLGVLFWLAVLAAFEARVWVRVLLRQRRESRVTRRAVDAFLRETQGAGR